MKDSHQAIRVYTHNNTDTSYAESRDTRQERREPGRSPQDQPCARAILRKGNDVTKGKEKNREALMKGKQVKHEDKPEKMKARARRKDKRSNPRKKWKDKHRFR